MNVRAAEAIDHWLTALFLRNMPVDGVGIDRNESEADNSNKLPFHRVCLLRQLHKLF